MTKHNWPMSSKSWVKATYSSISLLKVIHHSSHPIRTKIVLELDNVIEERVKSRNGEVMQKGTDGMMLAAPPTSSK